MIIDLPISISKEFEKELEEKIMLYIENIDHCTFNYTNENISSVNLEHAVSADGNLIKEAVLSIFEEILILVKKSKDHHIIFQHQGVIENTQDPHSLLLESRSIVPTNKGDYVYQGDFLKLLQQLDLIFSKVFHQMGCQEQQYPTFIDAEPLFELNYFNSMAQHLFFPINIAGNYKMIERFATVNSRDENEEKKLKFNFQDMNIPQSIISPTVCYHCFSAIKNYTFTNNNMSFTGINKCMRCERSALVGLQRLQTFTMREAIFVGEKDWISNRWDNVLEKTQELFQKYFDLNFKIISASDPFFGTDGGRMQVLQKSMKLKYEFQVMLPYTKKYLACGSINNHLNSMSSAFNFLLPDGSSAFSMCIGIGYERLALALLAQKGPQIEKILTLTNSILNKI